MTSTAKPIMNHQTCGAMLTHKSTVVNTQQLRRWSACLVKFTFVHNLFLA